MLERICRTQILALSTGCKIKVLDDDVIRAVQMPTPDDRHNRDERNRLYFEAMMRVLDVKSPGYAE
jgi:hypothetical protein